MITRGVKEYPHIRRGRKKSAKLCSAIYSFIHRIAVYSVTWSIYPAPARYVPCSLSQERGRKRDSVAVPYYDAYALLLATINHITPLPLCAVVGNDRTSNAHALPCPCAPEAGVAQVGAQRPGQRGGRLVRVRVGLGLGLGLVGFGLGLESGSAVRVRPYS